MLAAALGMDLQTVTRRVPEMPIDSVGGVAPRQELTIGHLARRLLQREVADWLAHSQTRVGGDERLVVALQALLASDIARAADWEDLCGRLATQDFTLLPEGGGLCLHKRTCGTRLCSASELGVAYHKLVKRFGCGMPGHPDGTLGLTFDAQMDEDACNA